MESNHSYISNMVSVIIATHNRPEYLEEQLQHIVSQKNAYFEIIIVNDIEEPEKTDEVVKKYGVNHYIKTSRYQGPSQKHKAGMAVAHGEYVYLPDDDDYLIDDNYFAKAVAKLNEDKDLSFVAANTIVSYEFEDISKNYKEKRPINVEGKIRGLQYLQGFQVQYKKPCSAISTIFRRLAFDTMDAIHMREMSDSSMHMIVLLAGDAYIFKDYVAVWRCKAGGITTNSTWRFVLNVLQQKEDIFFLAKKKLSNPRDFWYNQYHITYRLFLNNPANKRYLKNIHLWGLLHCHLSKKLFKLIIKEIYHGIF